MSSNCHQLTPYWQSECGRAVLYLGDCREVLPRVGRNLFHAVVTDPPYELDFMGSKWDRTGVAYDLATWVEVLRVSKPGAHLLSFGGTRTWHRVACAVEDSGYEMRDTIMWVYGSGFPKSNDISKDIDQINGVNRLRIAGGVGSNNTESMGKFKPGEAIDNEPISDEAKQWRGWGTTLKPALEPIIMARKEPVGTVASNTLEYGCGGINIDACRIGTDTVGWSGGGAGTGNTWNESNCGLRKDGAARPVVGRWPANLIHDGSDEVVNLLPECADRFFYSAKANDSDRLHNGSVIHPTVKPLDLMRYLVRLVCAKGGVVLDPFNGSGSTGCAAIEEGMWYVGIEQEEDYVKMSVERLREVLGTHPVVSKSLASGRRIVKDTNPPPPTPLF